LSLLARFPGTDSASSTPLFAVGRSDDANAAFAEGRIRMPLTIFFSTPGTYTIEDDGVRLVEGKLVVDGA